MQTMCGLVLALSLVGQMGSGVVDGGYDVPSTVYLTNLFTGSSHIALTIDGSGIFRGSDGTSDYTLRRALIVDKTSGRYCWIVSATTNGNTGAVGVYPAPAAAWGLNGNGFTVSPQ